jgi:DNA-binding MarR family transcriptional regulator
MAKKPDSSLSDDALEEPGEVVDPAIAEFACTHTSLRRAARRLGQLYDEALAPIGLTSSQARLLAEIDAHAASNGGEGPTLQLLAARLAIQISALTHALRPLVRDGLVEVRTSSRDRRTKHGVLTPLGKTRYREMSVLWVEANRKVEQALGEASAERLRHLADDVASQAFLDAYGAAAKPAEAGR